MKKQVLTISLCVIMMFSIGRCSLINSNKNNQSVESNGNVLIHSDLMNSLDKLGIGYEFVPLEYKGGVIRGIVSPTKIERYMLDSSNENKGLNPVRYVEYTINGLDASEDLQETGNVLLVNELTPYKFDISNPKNIILKDNKRKTEKVYSSKVAEEFVVSEKLSQNNLGQEVITYYILDKLGNKINVSYSYGTTVGKNNRYLRIIFGYKTSADNFASEKYNNIIYDSETDSFYESEAINVISEDIYEEEIMEVNNELYYFNHNGEIRKIILDNGKILFEDYYDLKLSANESIEVNHSYTDKSINGDFVLVDMTSESNGITNSRQSLLNMRDKEKVDISSIDNQKIDRIFSNSDNLVSLEVITKEGETTWISKYENGSYNKLVQIDECSYEGTLISKSNIEDIFYDEVTNSFFIKRMVHTDKKQIYQYEVLKLD